MDLKLKTQQQIVIDYIDRGCTVKECHQATGISLNYIYRNFRLFNKLTKVDPEDFTPYDLGVMKKYRLNLITTSFHFSNAQKDKAKFDRFTKEIREVEEWIEISENYLIDLNKN